MEIFPSTAREVLWREIFLLYLVHCTMISSLTLLGGICFSFLGYLSVGNLYYITVRFFYTTEECESYLAVLEGVLNF